MEETDREILRLLLADGRMSYTDLGRATGLSTSAVHQRVRRLEQRGVIKGYTAVVDFEAIGLPLTAFISVTPLDPGAPDDLPSRLADLPEIEACHSVAGERELHPQGAACRRPARWRGCSPGSGARRRCPPGRRSCCPRPTRPAPCRRDLRNPDPPPRPTIKEKFGIKASSGIKSRDGARPTIGTSASGSILDPQEFLDPQLFLDRRGGRSEGVRRAEAWACAAARLDAACCCASAFSRSVSAFSRHHAWPAAGRVSIGS